MKKVWLYTANGIAALAAATLLSGCFDDNYDLSDIDTTAEVKVDNLVLPINLDEVLLSNIFDLDDESCLKDINGEYVVFEDGDFKSDPIKIDPVTTSTGKVNPFNTELYKFDGVSGLPSDIPTTAQTVTYQITENTSPFSSVSNDVNKNVRDINSIGVEWTLTISVELKDVYSIFTQVGFHDVKLLLPKGLTAENVDEATGLLAVKDFTLTPANPKHSVTVNVTNVNFKMSGSDFKFTANGNGQYGVLSIAGNVGIHSGVVYAESNTSIHNVPQTVTLLTSPVLSDIKVKSFTGALSYEIDNLDVSNVELSDLPDFLSGDDTNVSIANPQLYLSLNNPLANYKVQAQSGLAITPIRNGFPGTPCALDDNTQIVVGYSKGITGPYVYCLSPVKPEKYYAEYANAEHVGYKSLSNVLAGKGLPTELAVDFQQPCISGSVENFVLGQQIEPLVGKYTMYAPLSFNAGSQVVYTDTADGWGDDTLDKIQIDKFGLSATINNSLPFDVTLTGYPITYDHKQCVDPTTGRPVTISEVTVKANSTSEIRLENNGTICRLDGLYFEARALVTESNITLSPNSPLKLTDIRVTVSGSYIDEL